MKHTIENIKKRLYQQAITKYTSITPCGTKSNFQECFTIDSSNVFFWFNTPDRSTRVVTYCFKNQDIWV